MKIAVIVKEFPKLSETFIINQITGLIDLGHEVDIYSRIKPPVRKCHSEIIEYGLLERTVYMEEVPANKGIRVLKALSRFITNFHRSPWTLLSALNVFKYGKESLSLKLLYAVIPFAGRKYDIIKCHFGPNGNFGAMLKKMGIGMKLVTMFHGHDIRKALQAGGHIYQPLFEAGDCFLANSDYSYKHLISFGADPKKVLYHPGGIDLTKFAYSEHMDQSEDSRPLVVLTVARLVHEKGLDYAIQAVGKLLDRNPSLNVRYHIVGQGPLENSLKKLVDKLNLNEKISFLGAMVQEEVLQEMRLADIFLLPSVEEALGLVLMEAQAIGLPVVATDVGSVSQVLKKGKSGFIVPARDANGLADKLLYLIEHRGIWRQMGKSGRRFIEENYDIKRLNKRLVEIYQGLLAH
jgi:colanic acid/amylovoran biosynthesis glycosyltransferase